MTKQSFTEDFAQVQAAEADWIRARREAAGVEAPEDEIVGLALSGGGIRSATFNLGVLQALESAGVLKRVDYLSSVSGGGFIGSCYSWLVTQLGPDRKGSVFEQPVAGSEQTVLDQLRAHGKYLIDGRGFSAWTLGASILAGALINLAVLLPLVLLALGAATFEWLPLSWPARLTLPGAFAVHGHDGYLLVLLGSLACLAVYLLTVLAYALITGLRSGDSTLSVVWLRLGMGRLLMASMALLAIGLIPVFAVLEEAVLSQLQDDTGEGLIKHLTYLLPTITGAITMLKARARSEAVTALGLALLIYGLLMLAYQLIVHTGLFGSTGFKLWLALSVVLAFVVDVNWISMRSYYRARLSEAFMPPVGAAPPDSRFAMGFPLTGLDPESGGPYQLVNTTLNTTSSTQEKLASRRGASFTLSALYCGSTATGFRRTADYRQGKLALSTAFSVSGAAVDPDTYETASRSVSALMTLLNVRLGFWTENPRGDRHRIPLPWAYILLAREMLGIGLSEQYGHIHLSDGGHFDNLGLYELLRRGCRYMIVSDAGEDLDLSFSDLGQVIERARADFGVEVDLSVHHLVETDAPDGEELPALLGTVAYPDGRKGEILYLKPRMRAGFTADVYAYWRHNPSFPDQSTADQFFDEAQFEAYRELGRQIVSRVAGASPPSGIDEFFERVGMEQAHAP